MCSPEIETTIKLALKNLNVTNYDFNITGTGSREDGYGSDMYFIQVLTKDNNPKTIDLVVKASLKSEKLREQLPLTKIFQKEIFIYKDVKTAFERFRADYGVDRPLEFLAKCYATYESDNFEALVFENLKTQNFALMDKKVPWSYEATVLGLKAYGEWHGLSFALRHNRPKQFQDLVKNNVSMFSLLVTIMKFDDAAYNEFEKIQKKLVAEGYDEVSQLLNYNKNEFTYALSSMFYDDLDNTVILHGDCWSNNFFIKKDEDNVAQEIRILDWQCSGVASPAFDLSHFIYACSNTENYTNVEDFLHIYYESFSSTLAMFNCKANEIFPYAQLVEHWKRFSHFGLFVSGLVKKFCLVEKEQNPDFGDSLDKGLSVSDVFNFTVKNDDILYKQFKANVLHYCKNKQ